jgi:hypothetical protein
MVVVCWLNKLTDKFLITHSHFLTYYCTSHETPTSPQKPVYRRVVSDDAGLVNVLPEHRPENRQQPSPLAAR